MKIWSKEVFGIVVSVFSYALLLMFVVGLVFGAYLMGYLRGAQSASLQVTLLPTPAPSQEPVELPLTVGRMPSWGGPDLWTLVNQRRVEFGVNPLKQKDELCTLAAIRLNELLELGRLDNHEGFSSLPDRRSDLTWIFEKYAISEFLLSGAETANEAVSLWENTLGHKKLLTGGEYVWGCIYAQSGMAVAIAAFE